MANSKLARKCGVARCSTIAHARSDCPSCPSHFDSFPTASARRSASCRGGICDHQTPAIDSEPAAPTRTEPSNIGSADRWILCLLDQAESIWSDCNCFQAIDALEIPSCAGSAKVSSAVFAKAIRQARTKGSNGGFDPGSYRYEEAQSNMGMSSDRRTNQSGFRNFYQ